MFLTNYQDIFGVYAKFIGYINYKGEKRLEYFIKQLRHKNTLNINYL